MTKLVPFLAAMVLALAGTSWAQLSAPNAAELLESVGIESSTRPEVLSAESLARLFTLLPG